MYANHKRLQMSSSFPHFLDLARLIDRVCETGNKIGRVRPFVCMFLNQLTLTLIVCTFMGHDNSSLGLDN